MKRQPPVKTPKLKGIVAQPRHQSGRFQRKIGTPQQLPAAPASTWPSAMQGPPPG